MGVGQRPAARGWWLFRGEEGFEVFGRHDAEGRSGIGGGERRGKARLPPASPFELPGGKGAVGLLDVVDLALREQTALTSPEQIYVLVDENTRVHALPTVLQTLSLPPEHICCVPAGEEHKTLGTVEQIWQFLQQQGATRHSLLFCLGGGVLTDMGGI